MDRKERRILICKRIAEELNDGDYVNLGIGFPTEVANHIPEGINIIFQSENGILGVGPAPEPGHEDPELINAGAGLVTVNPGASFFDSFMSFSIVRSGRVNMTVLGALQVDQNGNIANWMIPGKHVPGMGGAMDLVVGAKQVVVAMEHLDKYGKPKVMDKCNLPLTGLGVVTLIVTDMAVLRVVEDGLLLAEIARWTNVDDVIKNTVAKLIIPENVGVFG
jgi:acetate CoA/acetoacetate CoA-transferase beta subunit